MNPSARHKCRRTCNALPRNGVGPFRRFALLSMAVSWRITSPRPEAGLSSPRWRTRGRNSFGSLRRGCRGPGGTLPRAGWGFINVTRRSAWAATTGKDVRWARPPRGEAGIVVRRPMAPAPARLRSHDVQTGHVTCYETGQLNLLLTLILAAVLTPGLA